MIILKKSFSNEKREITLKKFGNGDKKILIIGGFHGDEPQGTILINKYFDKNPECKNSVFVISCLNPDGMAVNTRQNANGVDLNRSFNTRNFEISNDPQYFGGNFPSSEPETKFLTEILNEYGFNFILTLHSPYKVVNFDGPAKGIAQKISELTGYPISESIGYPTPGSFGTYAGIERNIPTITLELSEDDKIETLEKLIFPVFDFCVNF